jgi:outer membrane protein OmpA-like peptidoglycan-associated protein
MKKRLMIFLFLSLFISLNLSAETFRFLFTKGEKYRFVATVNEKVLINGKFSHNADFLNKIAVEVTDLKNSVGMISALYQVSERIFNDTGSYSLQEEYASVFTSDAQGRLTVDPQYLYPLLRNTPLFPAADISPGASWSAPGEEVHDMREYGIEKPYIFPVTVHYIYIGNKKIDAHTVAAIDFSYSFFNSVTDITTKEPFYPVKITGEIRNHYYFDIEKGKPYSFEENFDIIYHYSTGDTAEFIGVQKCEVIAAPSFNKTDTASDITKDVEKEKLEGVRVEKSDRGVKIVLENIQFEADSDVIESQERGKLERIAAILKKYPERDVLIVGHTAQSGTEEYLQDLSVSRAKAVGDFLLSQGARKANQMTIIGKGASEPIADPGTEEGRRKNRRVEIILLEN